jgi:hypothetical protein
MPYDVGGSIAVGGEGGNLVNDWSDCLLWVPCGGEDSGDQEEWKSACGHDVSAGAVPGITARSE